MGTKVTLELPDDVYQEVEQIAQSFNTSITSVLVDAIIQALPQIYKHPQREKMAREQRAFEMMYLDLVKQFEGQFVAVHNGEVVDHDIDPIALLRRRRQNYPNDVVLITQVLPKSQRILCFRSPRFVNPIND